MIYISKHFIVRRIEEKWLFIHYSGNVIYNLKKGQNFLEERNMVIKKIYIRKETMLIFEKVKNRRE